MQHRVRAGVRERSLPPPLHPRPPRSRASPRVCPPVRARAREVAGGCARSCSLCSLTPVAAPTHCTPPPSHFSLSAVCQCLSSSLPFALLSGFFPQEPAEVSPGRRFCPIRPDCRNPRTAAHSLPALPPLPHGPASLRRRRVEGDPDPTLFLRADKTRTNNPHEDCSVSWSSRSAGSLLGHFLGFLSGPEG
ncbi:hypothetical protein NQZ68_039873 [Dissostichus eleginoides]|uniref:Uncharacterized protein n=1 Tax=Dissostichus eleginoides TaxID=100907 RepID=A0AAD9F7R3_DISEL|nr:hypothetical protein NQZ68_039873 [Dissostichus eleginoides]KAK1891231.1 hypothetical protein KUDE01_010059 [Dissostichus eleginoides]